MHARKLRFITACIISCVIAGTAANAQSKPVTGSECSADVQHQACTLAFQAYDAARKLTPGMTRSDVETLFDMDGGLQSVRKNRYTFRKCSGFKIDVEFKRQEGAMRDFAGSDVIVSVSKVYVEPKYYD